MFRHSIFFALRHILRQKTFSIISIGGLAVGLTAVLLMALYIEDEFSFDRFHSNANEIFRVTDDKTTNAFQQHSAASPLPLAPDLVKNFPDIKAVVRLLNTESLVTHGEVRSQERRIFFTDPEVFKVFSLQVLEGNPETALNQSGAVVLSQSTASRYFGRATGIVGQVITLDKQPAKVTAVVADLPEQSHWQFDLLLPMSTARAQGSGYDWLFSNWYSNECYTYIRLPSAVNSKAFSRQLDEYSSRSAANTATVRHRFSLEKLTDIYLRSERENQIGKKGSIKSVSIFSAIAGFILLLACINFVNLSTARAGERAKEIGIKKVSGVSRRQLIRQFFIESLLTTAIALVLAVIAAQLLLPLFNEFAGKHLTIGLGSKTHLLALTALLISVGFLSGIYPALILSGFDPITALKGRLRIGIADLTLRRALVVFQFSISIILIIASAVVYRQLQFMQSQDLGFNRAQTMIINFEGDQNVRQRSELIRNQLLQIHGVEAVSASSNAPGYSFDGGWSMDFIQKTGDTIHAEMPIYLTDFHFLSQYHIPVVAGRSLSAAFAQDSTASMMINETALHKLGFHDPAQALGVKVGMYPTDGRVVGIFRDFHSESLQKAIAPMAIRMIPGNFRLFSLQINAQNLRTTITDIERFWKSNVPERPLAFSFLDETFNQQYAAEVKFGQLFSIFTVLAIAIACFGLFGLAMYNVRRRTKEIGVRRVIGASVQQIVILISKEFAGLVLLAGLIAIPIGYFLMKEWIAQYAYRSAISAWIFLGAVAVSLVIAVITISFQSISAALTNPARSLRSE